MKQSFIGIAVAIVVLVLYFMQAEPGAAQQNAAANEKPSGKDAVQKVYLSGVPHTDKNGRALASYDPEKSFFTIAMWGAPSPKELWGHVIDWQVLKDAGINTVWPWPGKVETDMKAGNDFGMQIILMGEISDEELAQIKDDPALFGNVWMDEPIGGVGTRDMDKLFEEFQSYRERVHAIIPGLPVFINDAPWIMEPARSTWIKWNTSAEVSCHDNYPILNHKARAASIGAEPNGIPQSVGLAVNENKQSKPVWLIVGAFDEPGEYGQTYPFRYPTPEQLRACVYTGLIHGATGIIYFIWDNYVPRDGGVIGISPDPKVAYSPIPQREGYTKPTPATPVQLVKAKALWEMMVQINTELHELTPCILSPTVGDDVKYSVDITGESPTDSPIRCLLKQHPEGGYVLLTVNMDDAVLKVTYNFEAQISSAQVMYENKEAQKLDEDSKSFTLTYAPFDTHLIRLQMK